MSIELKTKDLSETVRLNENDVQKKYSKILINRVTANKSSAVQCQRLFQRKSSLLKNRVFHLLMLVGSRGKYKFCEGSTLR